VRWKAYLARHFNHGATLVGINCGATGSTVPGLLAKSAFGDESLAAHKKFLSGAPLQSANAPTHDNPHSRFQENATSPPDARIKSLFRGLTPTIDEFCQLLRSVSLRELASGAYLGESARPATRRP
jgi:hypothetical protein